MALIVSFYVHKQLFTMVFEPAYHAFFVGTTCVHSKVVVGFCWVFFSSSRCKNIKSVILFVFYLLCSSFFFVVIFFILYFLISFSLQFLLSLFVSFNFYIKSGNYSFSFCFFFSFLNWIQFHPSPYDFKLF